MRGNDHKLTVRAAVYLGAVSILLGAATLFGSRSLYAQGSSASVSASRHNNPADERILINTDLITLNAVVTDSRGQMVSGLSKNAFTVLDNKAPQQITFFSDTDTPASIGIIFDVSGSMSGNKIDRARESISRFIRTSHEMDDYFLIGFGSRPQLLMDWTRDADALLRKLTYVDPHGQTALLDAVNLGVEKIQQGAHPRRALLLISDGGENNSRRGFREVRRALGESGATLYSVGIHDGINLIVKGAMRPQDTLDGLSEVTGGRAFYPQSGEGMDEIFERIALELRHQYSIGYRPEEFRADGRWHRVKVKVSQPDSSARLLVRSREGYFATTKAR